MEVMMADIVALGELLIDFTPLKATDKVAFERNAGGAPANVLAAVTRLGRSSRFVGCVGQDMFGTYLKSFLETCNIDSQYLKMTSEYPTTLAFVALKDDGDRDFSFYRNPGADLMLSKEDIEAQIFEDASIFHFGSLSLTDEPVRGATLKSLELAKQKKMIISYDPNLRPPLWSSLDVAKTTILSVMDQVDILKISEEELLFLTGEQDIEKGSKLLYEQYLIPLILVTLGPNGCGVRQADRFSVIAGIKVQAVDTTGAGDSHLGAMLYHIIEDGRRPEDIEFDKIKEFVRFANTMAAYVTTQYGSAAIMPSYAKVQEIYSLTEKLN